MEGTAKMKAREILDCPYPDAEYVHIVTVIDNIGHRDDEPEVYTLTDEYILLDRHQAIRWATELFLSRLLEWDSFNCEIGDRDLDDEFLEILNSTPKSELMEKVFSLIWDNSREIFKVSNAEVSYEIRIEKRPVVTDEFTHAEAYAARFKKQIEHGRAYDERMSAIYRKESEELLKMSKA